MAMVNKLRVGIPVIGGSGWLGGASHMELHVKAVTSLPKEERPQLFLIVTDEMLEAFPVFRSFLTLFDGLIFMGNDFGRASSVIGLPMVHCSGWDDLFTRIDFFFPVSFNVLPGCCAASWIHDFQHKYLPEFFSPQDIALRDELCRRIADHSRLVFCSSKAVEADFWRFYPDSTAITRVLALRVSPEEVWYTGDPQTVQHQYNLPDRFILCCNQFWAHKNHRLLLEAIGLLHQAGQEVHLVCTGLTNDFRSPGHMADLELFMKELGITHLVHILGQIPRQDQIQLIRRSLYVVQPSLFEGLSLIVQECRALGKTILLSDLDVHVEHEYGVYFSRSDARDLADKLAALLVLSQPGPDLCRETEAKLQSVALTAAYARDFVKMVEESQQLFGKTPRPISINNNTNCKVLLATSLMPTGGNHLASQLQAVNSWLAAGFTVVSLNREEDIALLQPEFPQLTFIPVHRDARLEHRAPYIYVNDILDYLGQSNAAVCGVIEPDICLYGNDLAAQIAKEAVNCLIYQEKTNIQSLQVFEGTLLSSMGCLFFDQRLAASYPKEDFCLGLPLWDFWAILLPIIGKVPVKRVTTPFAYHIIHAEQYDVTAMLTLVESIAKYAPSPFPVSVETVFKYQHILAQVIRNHSLDIALPGLLTQYER